MRGQRKKTRGKGKIRPITVYGTVVVLLIWTSILRSIFVRVQTLVSRVVSNSHTYLHLVVRVMFAQVDITVNYKGMLLSKSTSTTATIWCDGPTAINVAMSKKKGDKRIEMVWCCCVFGVVHCFFATKLFVLHSFSEIVFVAFIAITMLQRKNSVWNMM